jgi:hypothetical protein
LLDGAVGVDGVGRQRAGNRICHNQVIIIIDGETERAGGSCEVGREGVRGPPIRAHLTDPVDDARWTIWRCWWFRCYRHPRSSRRSTVGKHERKDKDEE